RTLHGLDLSANVDMAALGQILFHGLDVLLHLVRNAAQVAPIHRSVNVDHRLRGVMRNFSGPRCRRSSDKISEYLRPRTRRTSADGRMLLRLVIINSIMTFMTSHVSLSSICHQTPA